MAARLADSTRHSAAARALLVSAVVLVALLVPSRSMGPISVAAAGPVCATSGPSGGTYTATVCLSTSGTSTLAGDVTVTTTVTAATGTLPVITKVETKIVKGTTSSTFGSVLSDYASPYEFTLPTARWTDGTYRMRAHVTLKDGFLPTMPILQVTFANNVTSAPVSNGSWSPVSAGGSSVVLAAVGDGAGGLPGAAAVGNLVSGWNPGMFLYLGDVYNAGTYTEFLNYYGPTLGSLKSKTNPVPGNHETGNQYKGYYDYWNTNASKLYYSTDAAGWHLIGLDSNANTAPGTAQYTWLQQDLQAHASQCTLVYYHHPRFGLDSTAGNASMDAVWQLMAQNGVDVVLNGHEHNYQRWQPMNAAGTVDPEGITQLTAGTGGHDLLGFAKSDARVAKRISNVNGALKLTLNASGAGYQFVSTGGSVLDSGTAACDNGPAEPTPTATATVATSQVTVAPVADARVHEAAPTTNYGTTTTLQTDAGTGARVESYLKFTVSGLAGSVVNAKLRLYVTSGSADGADVYRVSDSAWTETGITWATRPARSTDAIDDTGAVSSGTWIELDVSGVVTGNGTYSLALATGSTDGSTISSRQSSTNKPQLVLAVDDSGVPSTSTPTNTPVSIASPTNTPVITATPTATATAGTGQLTLTPAADARVEELSPATNYGASTLIRTDAGSGVRVESYLTFAVSGLTGNVTSAKLRVYASGGSVDGPDLYRVTDTSWSESGITWANRPPRETTALGSTAAVATGTWIEFDVTSVVTADGTYSFALATGSTDGTDMRSRESTTTKPQLVISVGESGPPPTSTVAPTTVPTGTPTPTRTPEATNTVAPTATDTAIASTPTNTAVAPTDTAVSTDTAVPEPNTPVPTATPAPVTNTPVPLVFTVTRTDGGPDTVPAGYTATFDVCLNMSPGANLTVFLTASHRTRAAAAPETLTFSPGGQLCQAATLADRRKTATFIDGGGISRLDVYANKTGSTYEGLLASGPYLTFPKDP